MHKTTKKIKMLICMILVSSCIAISLFVPDILFKYTDLKHLDLVSEIAASDSIVFNEKPPSLIDKMKEVHDLNTADFVDTKITNDETEKIISVSQTEIAHFLEPFAFIIDEQADISVKKYICVPKIHTSVSFVVYQVHIVYLAHRGYVDAFIDSESESILKLTLGDWQYLFYHDLDDYSDYSFSQEIFSKQIASYYTDFHFTDNARIYDSGEGHDSPAASIFNDSKTDIAMYDIQSDTYISISCQFIMWDDDDNMINYNVKIMNTSDKISIIEYNY